ncbi:MAG: carboxylesterase family protein [Alphaproteobacteria bacterium]|nr:carboxylesterase family protein [Alphaproteobacteria bacterium]
MKVFTVLATLLAMTLGANAAPIATAEGPVEGVAKNGVTQFLGIPYAKPPVGNLRWMPPQPVAKWTAARKTDKFGPTCAQVTTLGPFAGPPNNNEDCLYLNVFTADTKTKRPVLVWIHGGGYFDGASNDYDPAKLVTRGKLVVVTFNYRLNLFGFMAHPAIDAEGHAFGNYGVMDMQAALQWVKRNAASFGGDPNNVTVGGQSAGAGASSALVVSPASKGLIHRAIYQSGGYTPFASKDTAEARGQKFAAAAGCNGPDIAKCLRALPASKITGLAGTASAISPLVGGPLLDRTILPRQLIDAFQSGAFNQVPMMMGTTRDEGNFNAGITQYFKPGRTALDENDYKGYLQRTYGGNAGPGGGLPAYAKTTMDTVAAQYPVARAGAQMAWDSAHSDAMACRGQYTAPAIAGHAPLYMYLFNDRTAQTYFPKMAGFQPLAYHTADIPYVFTGYHGGPEGAPIVLTAAQAKLSDRLVDAWANFARTGNPNGASDGPWPRWKKDGAAYLLQDAAWATQTNAEFAAAHNCGFWSKILLYK